MRPFASISRLLIAVNFAIVTAPLPGLADEDDGTKTIDVAPQPLASALQEFSEQTGLQVAYIATLAEDVNSKGTQGARAPTAALSEILESTGLEYQFVNSDTVAIGPAAGANDEAKVEGNVPMTPALMMMARASTRREDRPIEGDTQGASNPTHQIAADATIEEITVTGIRRSLAQSVDIKRESKRFIDAIVAEDIGKFPEENIAESLQRMPGVAITREQGEGVAATIRGLPPQLTRVVINGKTGTSGEVGREFSFDVFSADLFNTVKVIKSHSAADDEGGVAGVIELSTPKPFDAGGRVLNGSLQGSYVELADEVDLRASAIASDVFMDGRFGALLSIATSDRTLRLDDSSINGWSRTDFDFDQDGTLEFADVFLARTVRSRLSLDERERTGGTTVFQFRPTDDLEFIFDGTYTSFDSTSYRTNGSYVDLHGKLTRDLH